MEQIITKRDAKERGLKLFFTGVPCKKYGHISTRRVRDGVCTDCDKLYQSSPSRRDYHRKISSTPKYIEQRKRYRNSINHTIDFKKRTRAVHLKNKYNLLIEDVVALEEQQNNKCLICDTPFPFDEKLQKFTHHVDHSHTTGKVRGLLCSCCNTLLGMAKDNITILQNAIKYLQHHDVE